MSTIIKCINTHKAKLNTFRKRHCYYNTLKMKTTQKENHIYNCKYIAIRTYVRSIIQHQCL